MDADNAMRLAWGSQNPEALGAYSDDTMLNSGLAFPESPKTVMTRVYFG